MNHKEKRKKLLRYSDNLKDMHDIFVCNAGKINLSTVL